MPFVISRIPRVKAEVMVSAAVPECAAVALPRRAPADVQITGDQYRQFMEKLIRASRKCAGWEIPWLVAQATYHSEQDPADEEFRGAQRALWDSKIALEGPDTDALRKEYRTGVHFNAKGLQTHGRLWAKKVGVWLDKTLP